MLTVAASGQPATVPAAAWNAARTRSAAIVASASDAGQHGDEFLAAEARDHVRCAHVAARGSGEHAQRLVADGMAEAIVDRLEVIEVEHQHAHRLALLGLARDELVGGGEEAAPVEQAGQLIGRGRIPWMRTLRSLASTSTMKAVPTT